MNTYYGHNDYRNYLAHYGVVGMHWGIRRYQPYSVKPRGSGKGGKFVGDKGSSGISRSLNSMRTNYHKKALERTKKYKEIDINDFKPYEKTGIKTKKGTVVMTPDDVVKAEKALESVYDKKISKHESAIRKLEGNAGSSSTIDDMRAKEAMRHTKEVTKQAKKDAAEYAKARVRTGEGAGNRRKLINMQIQERSKDPEYKKAFDEYSKKQNYVKLSDQERRRSTAVKTAEALKRNAKRAVAVTATAATVAFYLNQMGMLEPIIDKIKR